MAPVGGEQALLSDSRKFSSLQLVTTFVLWPVAYSFAD